MLASAFFQAAQAQTAAAPEATNSGGVEQIIVTAERREGSAQNIPTSINALSAEDITAMGITDSASLSGKIPSLSITNTGDQAYFLRGVGTTLTDVNNEESVAQYVDGVYLYGPYSNQFPVFGLQRVEVLKGPQGTLFGRNTTGGLIQYVTRNPTDNELTARVGYGNFDTVTADAFASYMVNDDFGIDFAGTIQNQGDGWGENTTRHVPAFWQDERSFYTKAVYTPSSSTKLTAFFWYNGYSSSGLNAQLQPGQSGVDGVVRNLGRFQTVADTADSLWSTSYLGYVRLDQDLGFAKFVNITSYRGAYAQLRLDQDTTPVELVNSELRMPTRNVSEEAQLLSPDGSPLTWILGVYYFNGSAKLNPITIAGLAAAPLPDIEFWQTQYTDSKAIYGQATYEILPHLDVTAGVRYTDETETEKSNTRSEGSLLFLNPDQQTDSSGWSLRGALDYHFTDKVMGYVSYNQSLKSGGFNLVSATDAPAFKPEHLDAYEVGVKSQWFNNALQLNLAGFLYKFSNMQTQHIVAGATIVDNAARSTIKGIDADLTAIPIDNLTITASAGLLDGQFDSFPNATGYQSSFDAADPNGFMLDASGKETPYAPHFSGTFGATYVIPVSYGSYTLNGFVQYTGKRFVSPDNLLAIPATTLVNAYAQWDSSDARYSLQIWANNLFDKRYYDNALEENVGHLVVPGAPRTFGFTATLHLQ